MRPLMRFTRFTAVPPRARAIASAATSAAALLSSVVKPLGVGYALTVAIALAAQRKLQYFPDSEHPPHPKIYNAGLYSSIEEHEVIAADGTRCLLWHWPAPETGKDEPHAWPYGGDALGDALLPLMRELRSSHPSLRSLDVIQFHGNAGSRLHRLPFMHLLREGL